MSMNEFDLEKNNDSHSMPPLNKLSDLSINNNNYYNGVRAPLHQKLNGERF